MYTNTNAFLLKPVLMSICCQHILTSITCTRLHVVSTVYTQMCKHYCLYDYYSSPALTVRLLNIYCKQYKNSNKHFGYCSIYKSCIHWIYWNIENMDILKYVIKCYMIYLITHKNHNIFFLSTKRQSVEQFLSRNMHAFLGWHVTSEIRNSLGTNRRYDA